MVCYGRIGFLFLLEVLTEKTLLSHPLLPAEYCHSEYAVNILGSAAG